MGNFCWMCERVRPNEAFSGKSHGRHLCRECARLPKSDRDRKDRLSALWEMLFRQSNISEKNIKAALAWSVDDDAAVASLAQLVADIGRAHPRKRKRLPYIRHRKAELWKRMIAAGLVEKWPSDEMQPERDDDVESQLEKKPEESPFSMNQEEDGEIPF